MRWSENCVLLSLPLAVGQSFFLRWVSLLLRYCSPYTYVEEERRATGVLSLGSYVCMGTGRRTDRETAAGFVSPLTAPLCHIRARTRTRRRRAHVPQGQERDKGLQLLSTAREIGATSATGMPAVLGLQSKITSGLLDAPIMFPFARIQSVGRAHLVCAVPPYTTLYKRCLPRPRPPS